VMPVEREGKVVGYMELGEELDHLVSAFGDSTGAKISMWLSKDYVEKKKLKEEFKKVGDYALVMASDAAEQQGLMQQYLASSGGGLGGCGLGRSGISGGLLSSSLLGVGGLDGGDLVGDTLGVGCGGRLLSRSGLLLSSNAVGLVLGSRGVSTGLLLGGLGSLGGLLVLVRERVLDLVKEVH